MTDDIGNKTIPIGMLEHNVRIGAMCVALIGADAESFLKYTTHVTDHARNGATDGKTTVVRVAELLNEHLDGTYGEQEKSIAAAFLVSLLIDMDIGRDCRSDLLTQLLGWKPEVFP